MSLGPNGEEMPLLGHALQRVRTAVVELDARPDDEVPDGRGDKDLARVCKSRDAGSDMDGDAPDVGAIELDLARVETGSDVEPEVANGGADRLRAADRSRRAVEDRQQAIACRDDLASTEPVELLACDGVVPIEQLLPRVITERPGSFGGADDVREEHRREHSLGLGRWLGTGQKLLELGRHPRLVSRPEEVLAAW